MFSSTEHGTQLFVAPISTKCLKSSCSSALLQRSQKLRLSLFTRCLLQRATSLSHALDWLLLSPSSWNHRLNMNSTHSFNSYLSCFFVTFPPSILISLRWKNPNNVTLKPSGVSPSARLRNKYFMFQLWSLFITAIVQSFRICFFITAISPSSYVFRHPSCLLFFTLLFVFLSSGTSMRRSPLLTSHSIPFYSSFCWKYVIRHHEAP